MAVFPPDSCALVLPWTSSLITTTNTNVRTGQGATLVIDICPGAHARRLSNLRLSSVSSADKLLGDFLRLSPGSSTAFGLRQDAHLVGNDYQNMTAIGTLTIQPIASCPSLTILATGYYGQLAALAFTTTLIVKLPIRLYATTIVLCWGYALCAESRLFIRLKCCMQSFAPRHGLRPQLPSAGSNTFPAGFL